MHAVGPLLFTASFAPVAGKSAVEVGTIAVMDTTRSTQAQLLVRRGAVRVLGDVQLEAPPVHVPVELCARRRPAATVTTTGCIL